LKRERDELHSEVDELKEVQRELRELLAVIHCDGGHYRAEHGDVKSTRDAITVVHEYRQERDDLRERVDVLEQRLQFDPGGSDKIDELEQAIQFIRYRHELDHDMLVSIREDFERWLQVLPEARLTDELSSTTVHPKGEGTKQECRECCTHHRTGGSTLRSCGGDRFWREGDEVSWHLHPEIHEEFGGWATTARLRGKIKKFCGGHMMVTRIYEDQDGYHQLDYAVDMDNRSLRREDKK
jgi:hypothetical protein